jgi:hypothetical protein
MKSSLMALSAQQLRRAAGIKEKIQALENELNQIIRLSDSLGDDTTPKLKRKMSAAGRARIAAAQRARWAKVKATKKQEKR